MKNIFRTKSSCYERIGGKGLEWQSFHVYFCSPSRSLAVLTESYLRLRPSFPLDLSGTFGTRGTHFRFGPVAGVAAVTLIQSAHIEALAQIALQRLATLATITIGNHCRAVTVEAPQPELLSLSKDSRCQLLS